MQALDAAVGAWIEDGWICGAAAGTVTPGGSQVAGWGRTSRGGAAMDPATAVFNIGSITKIVVATILAELVEEGKCSFETPIQELLPAGSVIPRSGNRQITLLDLATHSSGLPANAPFAAALVESSGGRGAVAARLLDFVAGFRPTRVPGEGYEYSNVGFGLLGLALTRLTGQEFETMVRSRLADPLGMTSTRVVADPALRPRVVDGYTADGAPVPFRDHGYAGASGALRSTVADLLRFLALHLGLGEAPSPLAAAARLTHEPRFATGPGVSRGLGWVVEHEPRIIWHTGAIGGCRSFAGFVPAARVGLVLLTNSANPAADSLGLQALRVAAGLPGEVPRPPRLVAVEPGELSRIAGKYQGPGGRPVQIDRVGKNLVATGGLFGKVALYPTTPLSFISPAIEGEFHFTPGHRASPWSVRVRAWGVDYVLRRIGLVAFILSKLRRLVWKS